MASLFGGAFSGGKAGSDLFSRSEAFRAPQAEEKVIQPAELASALARKKKPRVNLKAEEEEEERREEQLTASRPSPAASQHSCVRVTRLLLAMLTRALLRWPFGCSGAAQGEGQEAPRAAGRRRCCRGW